ncbi:hypothetical protein NPIL_560051 [Nephila pilipes]|uniref:PiggyBac transposable element-derived protein domain-containing protein n=1 Tax=Nephila pilipes TaxID=299642 RepID=A0A8X6IJE5_NEPPI|nr:hypothetical protein NPIL_560051 [Nephila pilipes]
MVFDANLSLNQVDYSKFLETFEERNSTDHPSNNFFNLRTLKTIRWRKRKAFNRAFPDEEPSDIRIDFPELQDLDPIQLFNKILPKDCIGTPACITKLYASKKGEMIAIGCTDISQFLGFLLLSGYHWAPKNDYYWSTAEYLKVDIILTVSCQETISMRSKISFT